jgi:HTH-type transcriptional regulator/antitoxin HigA
MKPIRDHAAYEKALARIDELMSASEGSPEADELEVLAILVEKFEAEHYPIPDVPASEVLKLYMEENGLLSKDMVRYLGSPSAVSKILNGAKEPSVKQIRILARELKIPVAALIGGGVEASTVDWSAFPLVEMARRGLFGPEHLRSSMKTLVGVARERVSGLIGDARLDFAQARLRQGIKAGPASDVYAIKAWLVEVAKRARDRSVASPYAGLMQSDLEHLAHLSKKQQGLSLAVRYLEERGVPVVIVPHYRKSKIDGGVVVLDGGRPAIGLTLRYDRVDYFWFTLLHEAAHIVCGHVQDYLADDVIDPESLEGLEREANEMVEAVTIPAGTFDEFIPDPGNTTLDAILQLAQECDVAVAIVAGRVQYKANEYRKFARLVGRGKVRAVFDHGPDARCPS